MGHQDPLHGASPLIPVPIPAPFFVFASHYRTSTLANRVAPQTQPREEGRYRHTLDAALTIYRTEGWRAFFRGLLPSLLGITHVAVQFPLYEHLKRVAGECRFPPPHPATPCRVPLTSAPQRNRPGSHGAPHRESDPGVLSHSEDDRIDSHLPARGRADALPDREAAPQRERRTRPQD